VTHDQEEAMEVADEIVVINNGAVEQIGTPDQLYDQPVNDFVMNFLGPVTKLGGAAVRPHDIEILTSQEPGCVRATVARLVRLGFEVRVDAVADGHDVWIQISRGEADRLELSAGSEVFLRHAHAHAHAHASAPVDAHASAPVDIVSAAS
jgi:sulfate transport system ATP-binding protein